MSEEQGEVTHRISIKYDVIFFRDKLPLDSPPDKVEAWAAVAREAVTNAQALFDLLALLDERKLAGLCENYPVDAEQMLESVAWVGSQMCNVVFSAVAEMSDQIERARGE